MQLKISSLSQKFLLLLCLLTGILLLTSTHTFAGTYHDLEFTLDSATGEITIDGYIGSNPNLVIPAKIGNYYVTSIANYAFERNTVIKTVSFESGTRIQTISSHAFDNCTNLVSINLPSTIREIENGAFLYCSSLKKIVIPEGVTQLSEYVTINSWGTFEGCSSLTEISLPSTMTQLGFACFSGCSSLKNISLPTGLTVLGERCFEGSGLTSISIPAGVTGIDSSAFSDCRNLLKVNLTKNITSINDDAFKNCSALTSVSSPLTELTSIGYQAFTGCSSLSSLTFGDSFPYDSSIGTDVFVGCSALTARVVGGSKMEVYCINHNVRNVVYASSIVQAQVDGIEDKIYSGKAQTQKMTVRCGGDTLTEGIHYTTEYYNNINAGTATVKIIGIGNYVGTVEKTFTIQQGDLSKAKITLSSSTMTYKASSLTPSVKVSVNGIVVNPNDYTISYYDNFYVGTATVTVSGQNNYHNNAKTTFKIVPKTTKIRKLYAKTKGFKVRWSKNDIQTSGYQIQIARNSAFTRSKKTKTISNPLSTTYTFKNLKGGKTYYVRIRTFMKNGSKKYCSAWSKVKTIRTKK